MDSLVKIGRMVLLIVLLASCSTPSMTSSSSRAKPGDTLGDVILTTVTPLPGPSIVGIMDGCDATHVNKPGIYTFTCQASAQPVSWLGTCWSNASAKVVDSDWSRMRWTTYLDDHELDLNSFGTFDLDFGGLAARCWNVALKNPPLRDYTIHVIQEIQQDVKEGATTYAVGAYDMTFHVKLTSRSK